MKTRVIIHGGFFSESSTSMETKIAKQNALREIAGKAYTYLQDHSAAETVVYAVALLENDILFNAGTGSQIQSDGKIRMSASLHDGNTLKFSGVINVEHVQNPIYIAEHLMQVDDRVLGGEGAIRYARENGFENYNPEIPQRRNEYEAKLAASRTSTVGCVALDAEGRLSAATSTGGKGFEIPGRISDSATTAGNFCNADCGVSCTGVGEDIVSVALATKIVTRVSDGLTLEKAFEKSFAELKQIDGFAGAIAIDKNGNF
ncbi:MAG TPA: isoaspartyl peptidase/L-asparaginase, partial [Flavobacteriales bacterium]|nr:isoaspartyl peptidase/L-asparaginase [Flavobacteriales bacterium]